MGEKHKLLAVLFADIAGYTAMMQEDEKNALVIIGKFKTVIESETVKFNGRIVQYFGDGCLLSFESSTSGVDCAIALQKEFIVKPTVPVRIGMHMGEIVFKNNNAFGDGVNIASRIESMGVPGSVLVSKTINDQVINKSSYILTSLGSFEFMNVQQPIEVFALSNEGLVVPVKSELQGKFKKETKSNRVKWFIPAIILIALILTSVVTWLLSRDKAPTTLSDELRQQPVAVMSFENLTKDKKLDDFGHIIKDWISYGLLESGKAPIIILNEDKLAQTKNEKDKFAAIPTGVSIIINGRFFNQSDEQIATVAEILEVKTNKVLFTLNPVVAVKDSIMLMLEEIKKKIIVYWGDDGATSNKKPPLYNAYVQYLKGLGKESNYLQAKTYYCEALKLDSTFNAPLFALAALGINYSEPEFRDSVMVILQQKESSFTSYEKKTWESLKTRVIGDVDKK